MYSSVNIHVKYQNELHSSKKNTLCCKNTHFFMQYRVFIE